MPANRMACPGWLPKKCLAMYPKQTRSHPQRGAEGVNQERQAAQQGTDKKEGLAATKAGGLGLVT